MANRSRPSVYIRPIPPHAREADLREKFRPFGDIKDIYQPLDHRTRTPKNYAYIEFVNVEDAERAILDGHNTDFKGARLSVEWARGERKSAVDMLVRSDGGHRLPPGAAPAGMGPVVDRRNDPYAPRNYDSRGGSHRGGSQPRQPYDGGRGVGPAPWEGSGGRGGGDERAGFGERGSYDRRDDPRRGLEDPRRGADRWGGGRGYDRRDDPRSGLDRRDGGRGGYDRRDDGRGGYDRRDGGRGGYDRRDDGRGGYDRRDDGRGGYNRRDAGRGGYDRGDEGRGGYDRRGASQDRRSSSQARDEDRRYDGGSRGGMSPRSDADKRPERSAAGDGSEGALASAPARPAPATTSDAGDAAAPVQAAAGQTSGGPGVTGSSSPNE